MSYYIFLCTEHTSVLRIYSTLGKSTDPNHKIQILADPDPRFKKHFCYKITFSTFFFKVKKLRIIFFFSVMNHLTKINFQGSEVSLHSSFLNVHLVPRCIIWRPLMPWYLYSNHASSALNGHFFPVITLVLMILFVPASGVS